MKTIYCDKCGNLIFGENIVIRLRDRVIVKKDTDTLDFVTERFFECPNCGQHYTVTVIDREMRKKMQKLIQQRRKVGEALRNGNTRKAQELMATEQKIVKELKKQADRLKERYADEILGGNEHPKG